jgi:excinuclease ABC subunit A
MIGTSINRANTKNFMPKKMSQTRVTTSANVPAKKSNVIKIAGARQHNLKNISMEIPKNALVVLTGMSGSGKSSLAFDTLYAEGQRRYVESLSSYARQFLGVMGKPEVDHIEGLSPAISIDQKTTSHNPRSTVGTITEIYDYLRLLFARVGHPHCPNCGREIATQSVDQIVGHIMDELETRAKMAPARLLVLSPVVRDRKGEFSALFGSLQKKGYQRVRIDGKVHDLNEDFSLIKTNKHTIEAVIDRLSTFNKELRDESLRKTFRSRLSQSIEEALRLADGVVTISFIEDPSLEFPAEPKQFQDRIFSEKFACSECGISLPEIEPRLFSFNSPHGACELCSGLGSILKVDEEKILAPSLTLSEGAIIPFSRMMGNDTWWARLIQAVVEEQGYDFRKTPLQDMGEETRKLLLYGSDRIYQVEGENRFGRQTMIEEKFEGFVNNLQRRYNETESDFIRKEIEQYMERQVCHKCHGTRLKPEALAITIDKHNIAQVTNLPIVRALEWIEQTPKILSQKENTIGDSILKEIGVRLHFLSAVGLDYLTLSREASTLAGGEAQRIRLASQIGTGLTGVLYVLDEPTIGLHQKDNRQLIETLKNLRDKDNSVVVVEHDRDLMLAADYIFDFGPRAGKHGGEIVAEGTPEQIMRDNNSVTGKYLSRKKSVTREPLKKSESKEMSYLPPDAEAITTGEQPAIRIYGAAHHNLKSVDVNFPLRTLTCITGVSGSGKSTLLHDTLYYNVAKHLAKAIDQQPGQIGSLMVPDEVKRITLIDQSPIGKTPRSNPGTYTKIFDYIRTVFANTKDARMRGYTSGRFSFNVKGGRCETCQGDGQLKIEMQFLPDIYVTCEVCRGARYNEETLAVRYKEKNISEVLHMTVDEAMEFFSGHSTLRNKLKTLQEVGLGYIELGQPAPTLSGGEAQRVKLARELSIRTIDHCVYLLDEPTTGLHFEDIQKLLQVLDQLVAQNNTVIVIEHNLDVIKNADWIIDLGPEGGDRGGDIIATGTPQQIAAESKKTQSYTGNFLTEEFAEEKKK